MPSGKRLLAAIGPGLMLAATGVGAGDLATAGFSGRTLGLTVLWAVALGSLFKFALTEGIARWQLATGETFLEGFLKRLGPAAQWLFLLYLLPWSFFVGAALINACGVSSAALLPGSSPNDRLWLGAAHSMAGLILVRMGGYKFLEKVMAFSIGVMFLTVTATALLLRPDWGDVFRGLLMPGIPDIEGALTWTVALIGGVGGTLTVLCYGYWIREAGRTSPADMNVCRIDLAAGYLMTALFGMAMVMIGSRLSGGGKGAGLIVSIGDELYRSLGPAGRWSFLIGAWCAIFSSLLGVWQSVPYIFADTMRIMGHSRTPAVDTDSWTYRGYLMALAFVPMAGLMMKFETAQKLYAIVGACFLPLLALALLILNGRRQWVKELRNGPAAVLTLSATLAFFAWAGWLKFFS